ncbi:sensor domain-containing protein [Streptomyces sp. DSM 44917]|uniref:histidine kinase n=1 Tax=Streptomyces boetiae TaxID=3075541 RepID=A0ABU2LDA2_9ACTN|nr:sensor domain-containing protein [Streptomyces sp. DSM 44917]MDT0309158.1 sensor domain-containing protein [Streptomyces sp. DSM 44917]
MISVLRLPFAARTWREGLYALLNLPMALIGFVTAVTGLSVSAGLLITFVGLPLMAAVLLVLRLFGSAERVRARLLLGLAVPDPEPLRLRPGRRGPLAWMGAVLRSNVSWRSAAYAVVCLPWGVLTFSVVTGLWVGGWGALTFPLWQWTLDGDEEIGVNTDGHGGGWIWDTPLDMAAVSLAGLVLLLAAAVVIRGMAVIDRLLVAGLLGPSAAAARVLQLESDRSVVVDASAADLRRIERDLHDGAQARLVSLAMDLGLAKEKLTEDPEAAARMVEEAHGEVKLALQELRDLARGIHPAILTDRGLGPALSAVASRCTVPVAVEVDLDARPAEAIEGIAYFTASELLQNVSKHAAARRAGVEVWRAGDRLMLQVSDDGRGGADATAGSGLAGLAERLAAVDGLLGIDSPEGGPTAVTAALPWRDRPSRAG